MWETFTYIGTIAFALSGALVAIEEKYDLFGVYVLGLVTAFGGGVIRNLLIQAPVSDLWKQKELLFAAIISITFLFFIPVQKILRLQKGILFSDAVGLAAFSIQGAIAAKNFQDSLAAVLFAAVVTGVGGGVLRDVLAGRKPLIFQKETYAIWCLLAGLLIGLDYVKTDELLLLLFLTIITLRMISLYYQWQLPIIQKQNNSRKSPVP